MSCLYHTFSLLLHSQMSLLLGLWFFHISLNTFQNYVFILIFSVCMHAYIWVPVEDRRGHWEPWSWMLAVYCELNSDPLEDQQALITTEPSPWPLNAFFNTWAGSSFFLCHRVPITKSVPSSIPFLISPSWFLLFPSYFQVRDTAIKFWKH